MRPDLSLPFQRVLRWSAIAGLAAVLIACGLGAAMPAGLLPAYRLAVFALLAPAIGSLIFMLIHRCTGGIWGVPLRPFLLLGCRLAPWLWLLVLPLLFFTRTAGAGFWAYDGRAMLAARAVFYAVVLFGIAAAVTRSRASWVGPAGLITLVFTLHLLSDDWLVSLEPGWSSTAFSLVWLCGQAVAGLSCAILGALLWGHSPDAPDDGTERPPGLDWGNLLLTATLFWCYVAFAQFLIIWAGNLPAETAWYLRRMHGAWQIMPILLAALVFVAPLALLLSRSCKRSPHGLALAAALLVGGQFIFSVWLIVPAFPAGQTWLGAATATLFAGGLFTLGCRRAFVHAGHALSQP